MGQRACKGVGLRPGKAGQQLRETIAQQRLCRCDDLLARWRQRERLATSVVGELVALQQSRVNQTSEQLRYGRARDACAPRQL